MSPTDATDTTDTDEATDGFAVSVVSASSVADRVIDLTTGTTLVVAGVALITHGLRRANPSATP